jgi:preprotein translocase subunit SecA
MQSLLDQENNKDHRQRANAVRELNGLFILGTERHESRRIDNQLRGRAGRQGDPGESRFFVAMDDELMRLFGDKSNNPLLASWSEEQAIDIKLFSGLIEKAQKKVESHNFDIRKNVLEYDDVMNTQRDVIYSQRRQVLQGADLRNTMVNYLTEVVVGELAVYAPDGNLPSEWDLEGLFAKLNQTFPLVLYMQSADELKGLKRPELEAKLIQLANQAYNDKEAHVSSPIMRDLERHWTLMVLDRHWMEHLSNMEYLREGIGWRGMSGTSPVVLYKKEAFDMFNIMLGSLQDEVIRLIFRTHVEIQQAPQMVQAPIVRGSVSTDPMTGLPVGVEGGDGGSILDPLGGEPAAFGDAGYVETGPAQSPNPFDAMVAQPTVSNARNLPRAAAAWRTPSSKPAGTTTVTNRRVGRNDPCPCGSGKKYKVCCGR